MLQVSRFVGKKRIIKKSESELLKETEERETVERKAQVKEIKGKKNKIGRLERANVYIQSSYNNTLITVTDMQGSVVAWSSAGSVGFKGPKKSTPFAASRVVDSLIEKLNNFGLREISIFVRGIGSGRDSAIRALVNHGLEINSIKDITPVPHNGCRPRKPRRV